MQVHNNIVTGFIKETRRIVGDKLSTLPLAPSETVPLASVIRDNAKGIKPSYPYIVVDLEASENVSPFLKNQYFDEEADSQVYVLEHRVPLTITCYGKDSFDILNELRMRMEYDIDRYKLNEETGAVFNRFLDLKDQPSFLSTDFVESGTTTVIFYVETVWSPTYDEAKDIQRVILDGEIFDLPDLSDEPITIHLDEPKQ